MLFTGSLNAEAFEGWLEQYLLPSLSCSSVLIMDNAPIHRKRVIQELVQQAFHQVVFLPKYSPDEVIRECSLYLKPKEENDTFQELFDS